MTTAEAGLVKVTYLRNESCLLAYLCSRFRHLPPPIRLSALMERDDVFLR